MTEGHARMLEHFGDMMRDVEIVKDFRRRSETRVLARAVIQPDRGFFPVEAPVYEGDVIELRDPRGGVRRLSVKTVKIYDMPEAGDLQHIEVRWGATPV